MSKRTVMARSETGTCWHCHKNARVAILNSRFDNLGTAGVDSFPVCRECIMVLWAAISDTTVDALTNGYAYDGMLPPRLS